MDVHVVDHSIVDECNLHVVCVDKIGQDKILFMWLTVHGSMRTGYVIGGDGYYDGAHTKNGKWIMSCN